MKQGFYAPALLAVKTFFFLKNRRASGRLCVHAQSRDRVLIFRTFKRVPSESLLSVPETGPLKCLQNQLFYRIGESTRDLGTASTFSHTQVRRFFPKELILNLF